MNIPEPVAKYFSHAAAVSPYVGIAAVFVVFRRLFPAHTAAVTNKSLAELTAAYRSWEKWTGLILFMLVVPSSILFWFLLKTIAQWHTDYVLPPADVTFAPFSIYWALPAMFLGMLVGGAILSRISQSVLKDRYPEYLAYQSLRYGFDSAKGNKFSMIFAAVISVSLVFFGLNTYVQVRDNALIVSFFASEKHHDLADVEKIQTASQLIAPNGSTVTRREYVIIFKDGYRWSTSELLTRLDDKGKRDFVDLLAKKSGVPVEEIPVFDKGKL